MNNNDCYPQWKRPKKLLSDSHQNITDITANFIR